MRHSLIILFCFSFLSIFMAHGQSENEKSKGDSFLFSFIPGEADIQATYGNNSIEMERLNRKIWPVMNPLMDGEFHVLVVSHIYTETGAVSKTAVNTAMWRGNTVRKYLKNKYELDNKQISFYVDRSGEWGNSVHVYLLYFAMPEFANKQIFYSTDQSIPAISASLKRYAEVPYIYVLNDPDLCVDDEVFAYVVIDGKADLPYEEGAMIPVAPPVQEKVSKAPVVSQPACTEPEIAQQATVSVTPEPQVSERQSTGYQPRQEATRLVPKVYPTFQMTNLTVRTNLLPWFTVSPGLSVGKNGAELKTGSIMPNLELEYMFGGWGSVILGGTYSRFGYKGNPNNLWGVSALSLEPCLWFNDDGTYRGFNVGLQLKYGNFNVRDNDPLGHGQTGQFFGIGVMLNYLQPISGNFAFEAGLGFGSRMIFDASTYMRDYETQVSETTEKFSATYFMLNFRLALVYRFGFK